MMIDDATTMLTMYGEKENACSVLNEW